jgi:hypothetical protein
MTFEAKHPLAQLALDVVVSLAMFVVACIFSGWAQSSVTPNLEWMYLIWFALGMLPCLIYMRYRAVTNFDNWDIIAFSPMPVVMGIASTFLGHELAIFATMLTIPICLWIRHFFPVRETLKSSLDQSSPDGRVTSETRTG